jgi:hypothetical protein
MRLRCAASGQGLWDCHVFYDGTKRTKDLTSGIMQLAEATGLADKFPSALEQTLSALFPTETACSTTALSGRSMNE